MFRTAPYIPPIDPSNASDTQNFEDSFPDMEAVINDENDTDTDQEREQTDQESTDGEDSITTPSQSRSSSAHPPNDLVDVFDGYSFDSQPAIITEDDGDVSEEDDQEEEEDLSDTNDEDEVRTERSGVRGNNLFAPGVIDLYRVAVIPRDSTLNCVGPGVTGDSEGLSAAIDGPNSPSPIAEERRGSIGALHFPRTPETFLHPQSPPSTPTRSSLSPRALFRTTSSATISTMRSLYSARTNLSRFSLISKESTFSVDSYGSSSHA
jgi:hypothetical protein